METVNSGISSGRTVKAWAAGLPLRTLPTERASGASGWGEEIGDTTEEDEEGGGGSFPGLPTDIADDNRGPAYAGA